MHEQGLQRVRAERLDLGDVPTLQWERDRVPLMTVPNHDWARRLAEPTTETIQAELCGEARVRLNDRRERVFDGKALMAQLSETQTAGLHTLIRRAIAAELEKLEHKFSSRHEAIAPDNAAYWIAERAQEIRGWTPTWCSVTKYPDGSEDEQPFDTLDAALFDVAHEFMDQTKRLRMK